MDRLHRQRCFNHAGREAVARCPSCRRHFCRECVVEHDDQLVCAACLKKLTAPERKRSHALRVAGRYILAAAMILLLWFLFFGFGRLLRSLPASVHEGTMWQAAEDGS